MCMFFRCIFQDTTFLLNRSYLSFNATPPPVTIPITCTVQLMCTTHVDTHCHCPVTLAWWTHSLHSIGSISHCIPHPQFFPLYSPLLFDHVLPPSTGYYLVYIWRTHYLSMAMTVEDNFYNLPRPGTLTSTRVTIFQPAAQLSTSPPSPTFPYLVIYYDTLDNWGHSFPSSFPPSLPPSMGLTTKPFIYHGTH